MDLKVYKNKNLGQFTSIPIKLIDDSSPLDSLYLSTHFHKLRSKPVTHVRKSKHYASTVKAWEKKLDSVDASDLETVAATLGIDVEVFNPLASSESQTSFSGGGRSKRSAQLLKVKKNVYKPMYKPMVYKGGAEEFLGDINQLLNDDILLIDQWNLYLNNQYPSNLVILHQGTIEDPTNPEQLMCDAQLQKETIEYNGSSIDNYPQDGITYSGIGFDSDDTFTGKYMYYLNSSGTRVCFNISAIEQLPEDYSGYIKCPYTRSQMIDKKKIIKRFYEEKKYGNEEIYEAVKEYALSTYGEDYDEAPLEIDLDYSNIMNFRNINEFYKMYKVRTFEDFMRNLPALKYHEVRGLNFRNFTDLPPEIGQLTSLKTLDLYNNKLTSLPPEIGQLTSLEDLNIECNEATSLPPEIGQLTSLKGLYLDRNELTSLPPEIGQLTSLEYLYLKDNELTSLPPEIGQLTSLEDLDLKDNELTSLPPEIGRLTSLQKLGLIDNELTSLPPEIGQLTSLKELYLIDNELTSLPPEIGQLTSLKELYLHNNKLTSLPPEIGQLTSLTYLYLYNNRQERKIRVPSDLKRFLKNKRGNIAWNNIEWTGRTPPNVDQEDGRNVRRRIGGDFDSDANDAVLADAIGVLFRKMKNLKMKTELKKQLRYNINLRTYS